MTSGAMLLQAPNVHAGGGLVLLRGLLAAWPAAPRRVAFLDRRAQPLLSLPGDVQATWVEPTFASRLAAERALAAATGAGDTVLCLHGLPPLHASAGRAVVFVQNRLLLGAAPAAAAFPLRTRARIAVERALARRGRRRVDTYIVQTPSMAAALRRWHGGAPAVRTVAFVDALLAPQAPPASAPEFDFVYVADGLAHKNHRRLLAAWRLLADEGLRPRLALTLGARDEALAAELLGQARAHGLAVHNLGQLAHRDVLALYGRAAALVYPSTTESYGLPLVEAQQLGLPIVAAELDYVRDVCTPVQTFDPQSATSIARAVRRFLGAAPPPPPPRLPGDFWAAVQGDDDSAGAGA